MAGTLNVTTINGVSTLNDSSGVLATQNGMTGIAKAWVIFQGGNSNTSGAINGSFNVSSVTVNGTGDWVINFTNAMVNTNYAAVATAGGFNSASNSTALNAQYNGTYSTTQIGLKYWNQNATYMNVVIYGS
jgi:hypothetical protein